MGKIQYNDNGVIREIEHIPYNRGGVIKDVQKVQYNDNGTIRTVFQDLIMTGVKFKVYSAVAWNESETLANYTIQPTYVQVNTNNSSILLATELLTVDRYGNEIGLWNMPPEYKFRTSYNVYITGSGSDNMSGLFLESPFTQIPSASSSFPYNYSNTHSRTTVKDYSFAFRIQNRSGSGSSMSFKFTINSVDIVDSASGAVIRNIPFTIEP